MLIEKPRIPLRDILLYGLWPGFIKTFFYRLKGYRVGKGVSIGFGSVICGEEVEIGDHTSIGFLTLIRGKRIRLGSHVQIGSMTFLDTPYLEIGEGTRINEQVFVGGLQMPDSSFKVGRNCQIMQMSFINPARSIVIGDDSGIGGHCLIFGHSSFHSQFEGYAVDFAPIEIGNSVGLAWRVFVLPGTRIGDGTQVGANSVVSGVLPPRSLAVGFPARIVGKAPVFPKAVSDPEKVAMFRNVIAEMVRFFVGSGFGCEIERDIYSLRKTGAGRVRAGRCWRMQVTEGDVWRALEDSGSAKPDVFLSLFEIPEGARRFLAARNIMWIEVARKEQSRVSNDLGDEVSNFLRRFGVRTSRYPRTPVAWAAAESQPEIPQQKSGYTSAGQWHPGNHNTSEDYRKCS